MTTTVRATSWLTTARFRPAQLALAAWAEVSVLVAILPEGVGGWPRAVNAIAFLTLGPACAVAWHLGRTVPAAAAAVIAIAASLTVLVLSSQLLLILGLWAPWGVTALVALVILARVVVPLRTPVERSR